MPISITVEGANILTRCLIIFGQGAIRCHPYVLREMAATREPDRARALRDFDDAFFGHASFLAANAVRSLVYAFGGGALIRKPERADARLAPYYRAATRLSSAFALFADVSMLALGGALKRRERLSARLGDILAQLYLLSATLKRFEDDGRPESDLPLVRWGAEDALHQACMAFDGLLANYPNRAAAAFLRVVAFPFGLPHAPSADALGNEVALLMQTPGETRERLVADSHVSACENDPIARGEKLLALTPAVAALESRLRDAVKAGQSAPLPQSPDDVETWAREAAARGLISEDERTMLAEWAVHAREAVKVDDFSADFGILEALQKRSEALERQLPETIA
jgi:acyl-CoA dehydrogenase